MAREPRTAAAEQRPAGLPTERQLPTWPCLPLAVALVPVSLGTSLILIPLLWCVLLRPWLDCRAARPPRAPLLPTCVLPRASGR